MSRPGDLPVLDKVLAVADLFLQLSQEIDEWLKTTEVQRGGRVVNQRGRPANLVTKKALREMSFEQLLDKHAEHNLNRGKLTGLLSFAAGDRELFDVVGRRDWAHRCAASSIREELLQRFKVRPQQGPHLGLCSLGDLEAGDHSVPKKKL